MTSGASKINKSAAFNMAIGSSFIGGASFHGLEGSE
jgi:hypothetical protein